MSAVNSSASEGEVDQLPRAERPREPSMEEILASIRNIITEEKDQARFLKLAQQRALGGSPGPQIVYSKDADPLPEPSDPSVNKEAPPLSETELRTSVGPEAPLAAEEDKSLISPGPEAAARSSFEALSDVLKARSAEIADGMVRDLLRPMLQAWIDENLPDLVERLVKAEIERLTRPFR